MEHWRVCPLHKHQRFLIFMPGTVLAHCTKQLSGRFQEVKEPREVIHTGRYKVGPGLQAGFFPARALKQSAITTGRMVSVSLAHMGDFMMLSALQATGESGGA